MRVVDAGCRMCKHWNTADGAAESYGHEGWGVCEAAMSSDPPLEVVVAGDGTPALLTHPKFACVEFKASEDAKLKLQGRHN